MTGFADCGDDLLLNVRGEFGFEMSHLQECKICAKITCFGCLLKMINVREEEKGYGQMCRNGECC